MPTAPQVVEFANHATNREANRRGIPRNRTFYLQVAILTILVWLLYAQVVAKLVWQWLGDPNYSHGFFVPIGCALLLWTSRKSWM